MQLDTVTRTDNYITNTEYDAAARMTKRQFGNNTDPPELALELHQKALTITYTTAIRLVWGNTSLHRPCFVYPHACNNWAGLSDFYCLIKILCINNAITS